MSIVEAVISKIQILPPDKQQVVLDFINFLLSSLTQEKSTVFVEEPISEPVSQSVSPGSADTSTTGKSLWQLADDFAADLPDETIAQLPHDGAIEHDHYIYGIPKNQL